MKRFSQAVVCEEEKAATYCDAVAKILIFAPYPNVRSPPKAATPRNPTLRANAVGGWPYDAGVSLSQPVKTTVLLEWTAPTASVVPE